MRYSVRIKYGARKVGREETLEDDTYELALSNDTQGRFPREKYQ